MNTLQRYIFRRTITTMAASFAALVSVVWVTQILSRIDFAAVTGQSLTNFLLAIVLLTPQLMALLLPIAVVIAVVQVFTAMNADSEMAALSASGAPRWMIAKPVLLIGLLAGIFVLFSNHFIEPRASRALRDTLVALRTDLLANFLQEGVFTKLERDLTIYIDQRLPGNALSGIMVSDSRDTKTSAIYYAQSGTVGDIDGNDVLVMSNGQIHNKRLEDGSISVIRFNSYALSLSQFGSADTTQFYYPQERETIDLLHPDPDDRIFKRSPGWIRGEIHRRATDWLYPILYALVGLAIAGQTQSHRQRQASAFALAIGAALLYKGAAYSIDGANRSDGSLWWLYYALPIGAGALSSAMYFRGLKFSMPDRVMHLTDSVAGAIRKFRTRRARARAV